MTIDELCEKYRTGQWEPVSLRIAGAEGTVTVQREIHRAGLGDLVAEYAKHVRTPWWRRGPSHGYIERRLRGILNTVEMTWH